MSEIRHPGWSPSRTLSALGRIGYSPHMALLDIADNSVSAGATLVTIGIETESPSKGKGKAVLKAFTVSDNGVGMDLTGLDNALSLGSSAQTYRENTLSKFGLGLKSAAASLGRKLEIVTRPHSELGKVYKAVLDHQEITTDYFYKTQEPTPEDLSLLNSVAGTGSGTVVRVTDLLLESLPRAAQIIENLKQRAGVIYHYYLQGMVPNAESLTMTVNKEAVAAFDPLFTEEIDEGEAGNLDETEWDGLKPKWITRPQKIQLDTKAGIYAEATITQLPHPPSVADSKVMSQTECREKYMIGAGKYGFYVYRNHRLISWADGFDGLVPQDQDLYSFRGRFLIDSAADDLLNIDVTKSRIELSEIAFDQLQSVVAEAVKKSRAAWGSAKRTLDEKITRTPHDEANEVLDQISKVEERGDELDEDVAPAEEKKKLKARRKEAVAEKPTTLEESTKLKEQKQRVQWIGGLDNNQLWERAHDPEAGLIVRVNSKHRFARDLLAMVQGDGNLLKVVDIFFYALARGEYEMVYKSDHDAKLVGTVMDEYRERVGGELSEMIRQLDLSQFLATK